jgi:hypothetical protein
LKLSTYNLELVALKHDAEVYYQKWILPEDIDKNAAAATYFRLLELVKKLIK